MQDVIGSNVLSLAKPFRINKPARHAWQAALAKPWQLTECYQLSDDQLAFAGVASGIRACFNLSDQCGPDGMASCDGLLILFGNKLSWSGNIDAKTHKSNVKRTSPQGWYKAEANAVIEGFESKLSEANAAIKGKSCIIFLLELPMPAVGESFEVCRRNDDGYNFIFTLGKDKAAHLLETDVSSFL